MATGALLEDAAGTKDLTEGVAGSSIVANPVGDHPARDGRPAANGASTPEPVAAAESLQPAAATAAVDDDAPSSLVRIEDGTGFYLRVVIDLELMRSLAEQ